MLRLLEPPVLEDLRLSAPLHLEVIQIPDRGLRLERLAGDVVVKYDSLLHADSLFFSLI